MPKNKEMQNHIIGDNNTVAGRDVHIHYSSSSDLELTDSERWQYRNTLLKYRETLPELHKLLCHYAQLRFETAIFVELDDCQLKALFEYHQTLLIVSKKLHSSSQIGFIEHLRKLLKDLLKRRS
ncbi:hypothetical protein BKG93_11220 [Rodentibacter ratti]|uniref:Uncharacterized protein n=1 Tax=Rodentibacter ratti TaxID=1906745 RepID=A0A1V3KZE0_9PAST|nr:hypothetical protein [Rodentibacter ratti]OOF82503.1 hypothetical protein BKG93_11220 [Rodentibacter ratti]